MYTRVSSYQDKDSCLWLAFFEISQIKYMKKGPADQSNNYRAILRTSIPCKLLEHIVLHHLNFVLDKILYNRQHGFSKELSCETQLCGTYHDTARHVDKGGDIRAVVLEFAKAFDEVPHKLLMHKPSNIPSVRTPIVKWFHDFLMDRKQKLEEPIFKPMALNPSICEGFWDKVCVTNIDDCKNFTLKLCGSEEDFVNLMKELQQVASTAAKETDIKPDKPILSRFSFDQQWYRAVIKDVTPSKSVDVTYMDYGNSETAAESGILSLSPQYLKLPRQGVLCQLNRIDSSMPMEKKFEDRFRSVCLNQTFTAQFIKYENSHWLVEIYHPSGNVNDWFGQQTGRLTSKLIHSSPPKSLPHPNNAGLKGEVVVANGVSSGHTVPTAISPSGQTPPRPAAVEVAKRSSLPSSFSGLVVYSKSPHQFWIQLDAEYNSLMEISATLADHCISSNAIAVSNPQSGQLCAALYHEDNTWYRAIIKSVQSDEIQVYFIDYGNTESVTLSSLVNLPSSLTSQPGYAIECSLSGVVPASADTWTSLAKDTFSDIAMADSVQVTAVGDVNKPPLSVSLSMAGVDVSQKLREACPDVNSIDEQKPTTPHAATSPSVTPQSVTPAKLHSPGHQVNAVVDVLCVYCVSPLEFYCQSTAQESQLTDLMSTISSQYPGAIPKPDHLSVGDSCCALYDTDGEWYRAIVIETNADSVKVFFCDYGNTENVSTENIRQLIPELQALPMQALKCSLSAAQGQTITPEQTDQFSSLALSEFVTQTSLTVHKRDGDIHIVDMNLDGKNVASQLFREELMVSPSQVTPASSIPSQSPAKVATPAPSITKTSYARPVVEGGQQEKVFVSWLLHPGMFWVQKEGCDDILQQLLGDAKESASRNTNSLVNPSTGDSCIARYAVDEQWYRAEVVSPATDSHCAVLFVDYGNTESIPVSDIQPTSPSLLDIPAQAYKCSLLGVIPAEGTEWSTQSHDLMEEQLADGCYCTFLAKQSDYFVVEVTYGDNNTNLSDWLIKAGVAQSSRRSSRTSSHESNRSGGSGGRSKLRSAPSVSSTSKSVSSSVSSKTPSVDGAGDRAKPEAPLVTIVDASLKTFGFSVGQTELISVVHVEKLSAIYGQCSTYKAALDTLYTSMADYYHAGKGSPVNVVQVGSCYVVQFVQDNEWYRARIKSVNGEDIEVFYLDYGNTEVTKISKIKVLNQEFTSLPAQALCCSAVGTENITLTPDELQQFRSQYDFADVSVKFLEMGDARGVPCDLTVDGVNVCQPYMQAARDTEALSVALFYPDQLIESGEILGYPIYYSSQSSFYIQRAADSDLLNDAMTNVAEEVATNKPLNSVRCNQACLALYSVDGAWYRAKVVSCDDENAKVFFVDYGNDGHVEKSSLLEISEALAQVPPLAIHCTLATPVDGLDLMDWAGDDEVKINVMGVNDGIATVTLTNSLGEAFANMNLSSPAVTSPPVQSPPAATPPVQSPPAATPPVQSPAILSVTSTPAHSLPPGSPASVRSTQSNVSIPPSSITPGEHQAYLSHTEGPNEIYIQLSSDSDKLDQITEDLQTAGANADPEVYCPEGHSCMALYSTDNSWYRARVLGNGTHEGTTSVLFVDFGNSEFVKNSSIKALPEKLKQPTPVAVKCRAESGPLASMSANAILELLQGKELTVVLSGTEEPYSIEITSEDLSDAEVTGGGEVRLDVNTDLLSDPLTFRYTEASIPEMYAEMQSVTVSHMHNPYRFYCQFNGGQVEKCTELLQALYANENTCKQYSMSEEYLKCGVACTAQFDDDLWYRGVIISDKSIDNICQVLAIDYGNRESVPISNIYHLSNQLSAFPIQCVCCTLSGLFPLSGTVWDQDAISRFDELIKQPGLTAKVNKIIESEDISPKAVVSLSTGGEQVVDTLVTSNFCSRIPNSGIPRQQFCETLLSDITNQIKCSPDYTATYLTETVSELVSQLTPSLMSQLADMTESDEGLCTAQDIVSHVSLKILSSLLHKPHLAQLNLSISNKELVFLEVQNIIDDLMAEVLKMNAVLVDQMCAEGTTSASHESQEESGEEEQTVVNEKVSKSESPRFQDSDLSEKIISLAHQARQLAICQSSVNSHPFSLPLCSNPDLTCAATDIDVISISKMSSNLAKDLSSNDPIPSTITDIDTRLSDSDLPAGESVLDEDSLLHTSEVTYPKITKLPDHNMNNLSGQTSQFCAPCENVPMSLDEIPNVTPTASNKEQEQQQSFSYANTSNSTVTDVVPSIYQQSVKEPVTEADQVEESPGDKNELNAKSSDEILAEMQVSTHSFLADDGIASGQKDQLDHDLELSNVAMHFPSDSIGQDAPTANSNPEECKADQLSIVMATAGDVGLSKLTENDQFLSATGIPDLLVNQTQSSENYVDYGGHIVSVSDQTAESCKCETALTIGAESTDNNIGSELNETNVEPLLFVETAKPESPATSSNASTLIPAASITLDNCKQKVPPVLETWKTPLPEQSEKVDESTEDVEPLISPDLSLSLSDGYVVVSNDISFKPETLLLPEETNLCSSELIRGQDLLVGKKEVEPLINVISADLPLSISEENASNSSNAQQSQSLLDLDNALLESSHSYDLLPNSTPIPLQQDTSNGDLEKLINLEEINPSPEVDAHSSKSECEESLSSVSVSSSVSDAVDRLRPIFEDGENGCVTEDGIVLAPLTSTTDEEYDSESEDGEGALTSVEAEYLNPDYYTIMGAAVNAMPCILEEKDEEVSKAQLSPTKLNNLYPLPNP